MPKHKNAEAYHTQKKALLPELIRTPTNPQVSIHVECKCDADEASYETEQTHTRREETRVLPALGSDAVGDGVRGYKRSLHRMGRSRSKCSTGTGAQYPVANHVCIIESIC